MRTFALLITFSLEGIVNAQNWALINPAYKYNYSNDGTDTISNQIRVLYIDTFGPDSFRFDLNLIGIPCDTCGVELGGLCDGCYVWVDQPQFLQRRVMVSSGAWLFVDPDTMLILPNAAVGSAWPFRPDGSVTATLIARQESSVFGVSDSTAVILLSTGDSLIVSKDHGLLRFADAANGTAFDAIGIHGPDVGELLPSPMSYFDYHAGDALQYHSAGSYWTGGMFPFTFYSGSQKMEILWRDELAEGYVAHYIAGSFYQSGPPPSPGFWVTGLLSGSFTMNDSIVRERFHPVTTWPNQITSGGCGHFLEPQVWLNRALAVHSTDSDGRHVIGAFQRQHGGVPISMLSNGPVAGFPLLFPLEGAAVHGTFKEGIGMIEGTENSNFESWCELIFMGASLGGDTIGWLSANDDFYGPLSASELQGPQSITCSPNPADDHVMIAGAPVGVSFRLIDAHGRMVHQGLVMSPTELIDLKALGPGLYMLAIDGQPPQRFVIVR
ncbi:MAG: hypothetical protein IPM12_05930 [Flavobacteriales bacterium]|nr:hypothetical protein [Flavobacteriales bacterium]